MESKAKPFGTEPTKTQSLFDFSSILSSFKKPRYSGYQYFIDKCRSSESISIVICTFVTNMCCRNMNCRTVEYK